MSSYLTTLLRASVTSSKLSYSIGAAYTVINILFSFNNGPSPWKSQPPMLPSPSPTYKLLLTPTSTAQIPEAIPLTVTVSLCLAFAIVAAASGIVGVQKVLYGGTPSPWPIPPSRWRNGRGRCPFPDPNQQSSERDEEEKEDDKYEDPEGEPPPPPPPDPPAKVEGPIRRPRRRLPIWLLWLLCLILTLGIAVTTILSFGGVEPLVKKLKEALGSTARVGPQVPILSVNQPAVPSPPPPPPPPPSSSPPRPPVASVQRKVLHEEISRRRFPFPLISSLAARSAAVRPPASLLRWAADFLGHSLGEILPSTVGTVLHHLSDFPREWVMDMTAILVILAVMFQVISPPVDNSLIEDTVVQEASRMKHLLFDSPDTPPPAGRNQPDPWAPLRRTALEASVTNVPFHEWADVDEREGAATIDGTMARGTRQRGAKQNAGRAPITEEEIALCAPHHESCDVMDRLFAEAAAAASNHEFVNIARESPASEGYKEFSLPGSQDTHSPDGLGCILVEAVASTSRYETGAPEVSLAVELSKEASSDDNDLEAVEADLLCTSLLRLSGPNAGHDFIGPLDLSVDFPSFYDEREPISMMMSVDISCIAHSDPTTTAGSASSLSISPELHDAGLIGSAPSSPTVGDSAGREVTHTERRSVRFRRSVEIIRSADLWQPAAGTRRRAENSLEGASVEAQGKEANVTKDEPESSLIEDVDAVGDCEETEGRSGASRSLTSLLEQYPPTSSLLRFNFADHDSMGDGGHDDGVKYATARQEHVWRPGSAAPYWQLEGPVLDAISESLEVNGKDDHSASSSETSISFSGTRDRVWCRDEAGTPSQITPVEATPPPRITITPPSPPFDLPSRGHEEGVRATVVRREQRWGSESVALYWEPRRPILAAISDSLEVHGKDESSDASSETSFFFADAGDCIEQSEGGTPSQTTPAVASPPRSPPTPDLQQLPPPSVSRAYIISPPIPTAPDGMSSPPRTRDMSEASTESWDGSSLPIVEPGGWVFDDPTLESEREDLEVVIHRPPSRRDNHPRDLGDLNADADDVDDTRSRESLFDPGFAQESVDIAELINLPTLLEEATLPGMSLPLWGDSSAFDLGDPIQSERPPSVAEEDSQAWKSTPQLQDNWRLIQSKPRIELTSPSTSIDYDALNSWAMGWGM